MNLLVIADDLTGALDTGVQFAEQGICTYIAVNIDYLSEFQDVKFNVLIVDTNSRHSGSQEAISKINKIIDYAKSNNVRTIYKKTDSALRGNIGIELESLIKGFRGKPVLFVPAYPEMGRTTKEGIHYVNGIELAKTDFANDRLNPIASSNLYDILSKKTSVNIKIVSISALDMIDRFEQNTIYVFDAESEKDMVRIKDRIQMIGGTQIFAGCAGFAYYLPELFGIKGKKKKRVHIPHGKTLVLCGSIHPVSLSQVNAAENKGIVSVKTKPQNILEKDKLEALTERIVQLFESNETIILKTIDNHKEIREYIEYQNNMEIEQVSEIIANHFGIICKNVLNSVAISSLIVFGGDTLRGIVDNLELEGLEPEYQIDNGIPLCEINNKKNRINLISKAGGFGEANTLVDILQYLDLSKDNKDRRENNDRNHYGRCQRHRP